MSTYNRKLRRHFSADTNFQILKDGHHIRSDYWQNRSISSGHRSVRYTRCKPALLEIIIFGCSESTYIVYIPIEGITHREGKYR